MSQLFDRFKNLSGSLLVAHPGLLDPNFRRTVVLISAHSADDGALGVVLNRPLEKQLGDFKEEFAGSRLGRVPLYYGGPVSTDEMLLLAWKWDELSDSLRLHFGISPEKAEQLLEDEPDLDLRGFIGYSGWRGGQLEGELQQKAWVVGPLDDGALTPVEGERIWKDVLLRIRPELTFLTDAPEDPSRN